jgi:hypothetical protein
VVVIVWYLDLQLPVQSVPITTKVVSLNPVHGEVYSIEHYVIKFVNDLRQVGGFLRVPPFLSKQNALILPLTLILRGLIQYTSCFLSLL